MRKDLYVATHAREAPVDITEQVRAAVAESGVRDGVCGLYAQGATAALMVQENWDASVCTYVVDCLRKVIPRGV